MKTFLKYILITTFIALFLIILFCLCVAYPKTDRKFLLKKDDNLILNMIYKLNYQSHWDAAEDYRITPNILTSSTSFSGSDVTLVTQCSTQNLHYLNSLIKTWQGPISLAVFSKTSDVVQTLTYIAQLSRCYEDIAQYVTFHVVTFEGNGNIKYKNVGPSDCVSLNDFTDTQKNYYLSTPYPVNLMRNVAKEAVKTEYILLIDVDMLPSPGLRLSWLNFDKSSIESDTIHIVPAFEIEKKVPSPPSKADVIKLVHNGVMRPFYSELCGKCHACVDYVSWYKLSSSNELSVGYKTTWSDPCEPFYIASTNIPDYDESFKQYGFNRISQVCELHVAGFKFAVLDNAFLVHIGLKTKDDFHSSKDIEQEVNRKQFREFKQRLSYKYADSPRHC